MKSKFLFAAITILTSSSAWAGSLSVKGSDTMVILGQRWAEEYTKKVPNTTVQITGGGSGTGISALINGTTDICQASRAMKDPEKAQVKEKRGKEAVETVVARDGLSIYVNASNPLKEITMDQLKSIYTGKMENWKDVGGPDQKILPYGRENSSGTYVFFKEHVLGGADFGPRTQTLAGTAGVVSAVAKDKGGIGYGGAAYAKEIKVLKVKKDAASPAIEPDQKNVLNGSYPLARPLFFYTAGQPTADGKAFIEWVLSKEGQSIVEKVGYFPAK